MKVLILGSGGREHAFAWSIYQSDPKTKIYCVPGNAGTTSVADNIDIGIYNMGKIRSFAYQNEIDLTIVGPSVPIAKGIVGYFRDAKLWCLGPDSNQAKLEVSKAYGKEILQQCGIPIARHHLFDSFEQATEHMKLATFPQIIKTEGLAPGKGVFLVFSYQEAVNVLERLMIKHVLGTVGKRVIIEEYLSGDEVSCYIISDGESFRLLPPTIVYKPLYDGDLGPITEGIGTYAPPEIWDTMLANRIEKRIIEPLWEYLQKENIKYKGILGIDILVIRGEPYVIEMNITLGDPQAQVIIPLLNIDMVDLMVSIKNRQLHNFSIKTLDKVSLAVITCGANYPKFVHPNIPITIQEDPSTVEDLYLFHNETYAKDQTIFTDSGRVLSVVGLGDNLHQAREKVYSFLPNIQYDGIFYRRDVGKRIM